MFTVHPYIQHIQTSRLRRPLIVVCTLLACGLMLTSAYFFRPGTQREFIAQAALCFLLGGLVLGGALSHSDTPPVTLTPAQLVLTPTRIRWWMVGLGALLLWLVSESNGRRLVPALASLSPHLQFGLLFGGALFVGWGLAGEIRLRGLLANRKVALCLGAVTLIGLVVRVWGLDITARFMQDETIFIDALKGFWNGSNPGLLNGGGGSSITNLYPYWNAITVELIGRNLIGLRMASALLGALAVPAAYGLAGALFNRKLGLMAALLVATFPPHIHLNRISWGAAGDALFGLVALMYATRAIRWNRRVDWAFAGVAFGFTQYFYEVGRLFFPPLILAWLVWLMIGWKMQTYRRGIVIAAVAAFLVAIPVYYSIASRGVPVTPRFNESGRGPDYWINLFEGGLDGDERRELADRLLTPFLVYTHHPDNNAEFYGGFAGFVPPQLVPLFLLGVAWVIWRARYPVVVLFLALLLISLGNVTVNHGGFAARYVVVTAIIPIVMSVGLYSVLRLLLLDQHRPLLAGLAVAVAIWQLYFYYGIHLPYYNVQRRQLSAERDVFDAVLRTTNLPENTEVFLIDPAPYIDYGRANRLYLFLQDARYHLQAPTISDFDPASLPRDRNYAFFVAPEDTATTDKILAAFPDVQPPQYTTYPIPEWDQYVLLFVDVGQ